MEVSGSSQLFKGTLPHERRLLTRVANFFGENISKTTSSVSNNIFLRMLTFQKIA
jgi:hypothetical protein